MFRVYKPRDMTNVQAELVTKDSVADICKRLSGRLMHRKGEDSQDPREGEVVGFQVATFDGVKNFQLGQWVVKNDAGDVGSMNDEEFDAKYTLARNTTRSGE